MLCLFVNMLFQRYRYSKFMEEVFRVFFELYKYEVDLIENVWYQIIFQMESNYDFFVEGILS